MDGARQQFLARAAFAGDEHARVGAGDHVRLREFFLDERAARDDFGAPVFVVVGEAGDAQGLLHLVQQLLFVDRLGQEAEGAELGGVHGVGNGAVGGEDDDFEARIARLQFLEQADAVHLVHAQVGDDQLGPEAARGGERERGALDGFDFVVLRAQADGEQAQQTRIVVDDQDAGFALGGMRGGELHGGVHQKPLRFPSLRRRSPPVVRRAFDVCDGVQFGLGVRKRLLETVVFLALGGQASRQLRDAFIRVSFGSRLQAPNIRLKRLLALDLLQLQERESAFRREQSLRACEDFTQKSLCDDRIGARVAGGGQHHGITQHPARRGRGAVVVVGGGEDLGLFGRACRARACRQVSR